MQHYTLILIARDPIIRAGIHALLSGVPDITILTEAIDRDMLAVQLAEQRPQVVLVCLDPEFDQEGAAIIQMSKTMQPTCKVLVLAHDQRTEMIRRYLLAGTDGYFLHGVEQASLAKAIRNVVQYGLGLSQHVAQVVREPLSIGEPTTLLTMLTVREQEVLKEVARGRTNVEIAQRLNISVDTVRTHLKHIYDKLQLDSRAALIGFAVQAGMLPGESERSSTA